MPAANESVIMTMFMALRVKVNRLRHATGERGDEGGEGAHELFLRVVVEIDRANCVGGEKERDHTSESASRKRSSTCASVSPSTCCAARTSAWFRSILLPAS